MGEIAIPSSFIGVIIVLFVAPYIRKRFPDEKGIRNLVLSVILFIVTIIVAYVAMFEIIRSGDIIGVLMLLFAMPFLFVSVKVYISSIKAIKIYKSEQAVFESDRYRINIVNIGDNGIKVSWWLGVHGYYELEYRESSTEEWKKVTDYTSKYKNSYTVKGLKSNHTIQFRVRAKKGIGFTDWLTTEYVHRLTH